MQLAPCAVGSINTPAVMGPPHTLAVHAPEVAAYSQPTSHEDQCMMALVAFLWEELAGLCQHVDAQECSPTHNDGDEAKHVFIV